MACRALSRGLLGPSRAVGQSRPGRTANITRLPTRCLFRGLSPHATRLFRCSLGDLGILQSHGPAQRSVVANSVLPQCCRGKMGDAPMQQTAHALKPRWRGVGPKSCYIAEAEPHADSVTTSSLAVDAQRPRQQDYGSPAAVRPQFRIPLHVKIAQIMHTRIHNYLVVCRRRPMPTETRPQPTFPRTTTCPSAAGEMLPNLPDASGSSPGSWPSRSVAAVSTSSWRPAGGRAGPK